MGWGIHIVSLCTAPQMCVCIVKFLTEKKSRTEKNVVPKKFGPKKILDQNSRPKFFFSPKIFLQQFFCPKFFESEFDFGPNFFWALKILKFFSDKFSDQFFSQSKFFLVWNFFWSKFLWVRIFFGPNFLGGLKIIVGLKIFFSSKFFGLKFFLEN